MAIVEILPKIYVNAVLIHSVKILNQKLNRIPNSEMRRTKTPTRTVNITEQTDGLNPHVHPSWLVNGDVTDREVPITVGISFLVFARLMRLMHQTVICVLVKL
jgi:hypothetical protein